MPEYHHASRLQFAFQQRKAVENAADVLPSTDHIGFSKEDEQQTRYFR